MSKKVGFFHYWGVLFSSGCSVPRKALSNPNFIFSFMIIMVISSGGVWAPRAFDMNLASVCYVEFTVPTSEASRSISLTGLSEEELLSIDVVKPPPLITDNSQEMLRDHKNRVAEEACGYVSELPIVLFQGFSVFMFSLGILGGVAFEFFVKLRSRLDETESDDDVTANAKRMNDFGGFFVWLIAFILSFYGLKEPTLTNYYSLFGCFCAVSLWVCVNFNKSEFKQPKPEPGNIEAAKNETPVKLKGSSLT